MDLIFPAAPSPTARLRFFLVQAFLLIFSCGWANANAQITEVELECAALFAASGAKPGSPSCRSVAYGANANLANYYCVLSAPRIKLWCGPGPKLIGVFNGVFNSL